MDTQTFARNRGLTVALIETGPTVARQIEHRLRESGLVAEHTRHGNSALHVSGNLAQAERVMRRLWAEDASIAALLQEQG